MFLSGRLLPVARFCFLSGEVFMLWPYYDQGTNYGIDIHEGVIHGAGAHVLTTQNEPANTLVVPYSWPATYLVEPAPANPQVGVLVAALIALAFIT